MSSPDALLDTPSLDGSGLPQLPPLFRLVPRRDGGAFAAACRDAEAGAEAGTLHWTRRTDLLDAAVVLEPDRPLADTRLAPCVAMLALADALVAHGPPNVKIALGGPEGAPDRLLVNGGWIGGVRFAVPEGTRDPDVPGWAVVGFGVDTLGDPDDDSPGRDPTRTALREEGFGELDAAELLESVARHLLAWMDVWENDGDAPILRAWSRALGGKAGAGTAAFPARPSWTLPERSPRWTRPNA